MSRDYEAYCTLVDSAPAEPAVRGQELHLKPRPKQIGVPAPTSWDGKGFRYYDIKARTAKAILFQSENGIGAWIPKTKIEAKTSDFVMVKPGFDPGWREVN